MKKYIFRIAIFTFVLFSACESFVDIEQPGRLGEEQAFQSTSDLEAGLLGVYNQFDYTTQIQFNAVFTDMVSIGFDNGGQGIGNGEYGFRLNSQSAVATALWTDYYSALNAASRVIEAAALVTPEEGEEERYNNILAQAHALRAWGHFELLTYFSPDLTDDSAPGVIILDFVPGVDDNLPRNTTGEVFNAIEGDLTVASNLIVEESNATFVSADFITALRARIAAYRGNYAAADGFAADLLGKYSLSDRATYVDMFADEAQGEVIFKLERTVGDDYDGQGATGSAFASGWAGANFAFVNAAVDGSPYFEMSNSLFNVLEEGDIRYDVLVQETADLEKNIIPIGKYEGSENQPLMNDLKIFRASEMLFIRAEAAASAGNLGAAATFIKQLQDARYETAQPMPTYANAAAAFEDILDERRKEMAYEGFRWVDIKRLGALANISGITRAASDCAINGACQLALSDVRLDAVPIPLVELDANPNISQTPGF